MGDDCGSMSMGEGKTNWRAWLHKVPPLVYWLAAAILLVVAITVPAMIWQTWNAATVGAIVAAIFIGLPPFLDAVDKRRATSAKGAAKVGSHHSSNGSSDSAGHSLSSIGATLDHPQTSTQREDRPATPGADRMSWDIRLNPVVAALAQAIPDRRAISTITVQGGLDPATLDPEGAPDTRWQVVMQQAWDRGDSVVDEILTLALARSPSNRLRSAVDAYRAHRANSK
jgi:hypothetical protein